MQVWRKLRHVAFEVVALKLAGLSHSKSSSVQSRINILYSSRALITSLTKTFKNTKIPASQQYPENHGRRPQSHRLPIRKSKHNSSPARAFPVSPLPHTPPRPQCNKTEKRFNAEFPPTKNKRVYDALLQIPAGRVATYASLARALGSSPRAVGGALRRNPFAPRVPCHRVVQANGVSSFFPRLYSFSFSAGVSFFLFFFPTAVESGCGSKGSGLTWGNSILEASWASGTRRRVASTVRRRWSC